MGDKEFVCNFGGRGNFQETPTWKTHKGKGVMILSWPLGRQVMRIGGGWNWLRMVNFTVSGFKRNVLLTQCQLLSKLIS